MKVRFACTNRECGKMLRISVEMAGRRGRCPFCGTVQFIPAEDSLPEETVQPAELTPAKSVAPAKQESSQDPPWAPKFSRTKGEVQRRPMAAAPAEKPRPQVRPQTTYVPADDVEAIPLKLD